MTFYAAMDNWVYLLFGALWIAFAIYKGNKKATGRDEKREEKTSVTSSELDKIVDSFLKEEDIVEEIPKSKAEEVVEKPVAEPEKPVVINEGVRSTTSENEPENTFPHPKSRKLNLKQAIIYSEILRRPYE